MAVSTVEPPSPLAPMLAGHKGRGDMISRLLTSAAGVFVLVLLAAIAVFLIVKAIPALDHDTTSFWGTKLWQPDAAKPTFGILALAFGTIETAVIALIVAWPVAMAVALFVAEYAPRRLARMMGYLLDLLAAVPSVVYGLWGLFWLVPRMNGLQTWMGHHLSWIPIFTNRFPGPNRSPFVVGVVLAIMILPIISAIIREVVVQADPQQKEAALALGATHWEMIRMAVLPPSKSGIIGATILGLGRALGETIAVALILASSFIINLHILEPGGNTIAGNIAVQFGEAGSIGRSALIASGLVLFGITLIVNFAARLVISRSQKAAA
jgi:phosphate transport system permease protein